MPKIFPGAAFGFLFCLGPLFLGCHRASDVVPVAVPDDEAKVVADTIAKSAATGEIGDGKIFLIPVAEAIRIRTREEGEVAIT